MSASQQSTIILDALSGASSSPDASRYQPVTLDEMRAVLAECEAYQPTGLGFPDSVMSDTADVVRDLIALVEQNPDIEILHARDEDGSWFAERIAPFSLSVADVARGRVVERVLRDGTVRVNDLRSGAVIAFTVLDLDVQVKGSDRDGWSAWIDGDEAEVSGLARFGDVLDGICRELCERLIDRDAALAWGAEEDSEDQRRALGAVRAIQASTGIDAVNVWCDETQSAPTFDIVY